jgi:hypothetical protein
MNEEVESKYPNCGYGRGIHSDRRREKMNEEILFSALLVRD